MDMESTCFLCCGCGIGTRQEKVRLRGIFRYLKINIDPFLSDSGSFVKEDVVALCMHCSSMIVPLDKMCMELEVLQMKVDHTLKYILDVLEDSTGGGKSPSNLLKEIFGQRASGPMKLLREQMKKKCQKKIIQALPKVQISQVLPKVQILASDPSILFNSSNSKIFIDESIFENVANENPHKESPFPFQSTPAKRKKAKQSETVQKCVQDPVSKTKRKPQQCNFCQPPRMISYYKAYSHKVHCHPEHWFISSKQSYLTINEFKEYCKHIVELEVRSCDKMKDVKGCPIMKCAHCQYTYLTANMNGMRVHVCTVHKVTLARKLVQLQQSTTISEFREICSSSPSTSRRKVNSRAYKCSNCIQAFGKPESLKKHMQTVHNRKCDHCGKQFRFWGSLREHIKFKHNGNPSNEVIVREQSENESFQENGLKRKSKGETCSLCHPLQLVATKEHKIRYHLDQWFLSSKLPHQTIEDFKEYCEHVVQGELFLFSTKLYDEQGTMKVKCPHCSLVTSTYGNMRNLRVHMCTVHKKIVQRKLSNLQQSITPERLKTVPLPSLNWSKEDRIKSNRSVSKCDVCGHVFQHIASLRRHKLTKHGNLSQVCDFGSSNNSEVSTQLQVVEHSFQVPSGNNFYDESMDMDDSSDYHVSNITVEGEHLWKADFSNVLSDQSDNHAEVMESEMKILPD